MNHRSLNLELRKQNAFEERTEVTDKFTIRFALTPLLRQKSVHAFSNYGTKVESARPGIGLVGT